jgi:hypothetical protein
MSLPGRIARSARWRTALVATVVVVVAGGGTAAAVTMLGDAGQGDVPAVAVPAEHRAPLAEAARSCPALTPARLAGQVMAESRFVADAVNDRGGRGLAGLTDDAWRTWQPWASAGRLDPGANVAALAHQLCHLAGQVRGATIQGDEWPLAVAAYRLGPAAVLSVRGVPDEARDYVDRVQRYATWYAGNATLDDRSLLAADPDETKLVSPSADAAPSSQSPPARRDAAAAPSDTDTDADADSPSRASSPRQKAATTTQTSSPKVDKPSIPGSRLVNDEFHGCLSAGRAQDGTQLTITGCNDSTVQRWEPRSDGTMRSSGLCMDAANAGTADFTPVQVAYCSGNPAQQFRFRGKQLYSSYADKCVNVHYAQGKGTSIVLFSCLSQSNQYFRMAS